MEPCRLWFGCQECVAGWGRGVRGSFTVQASDDGTVVSHPVHTDGENEGKDRRQSLRDRRDGQRDTAQRDVDQRLAAQGRRRWRVDVPSSGCVVRVPVLSVQMTVAGLGTAFAFTSAWHAQQVVLGSGLGIC